MRQLPAEEWVSLGHAWQQQEADLELSEQELEARLRRRRVMVILASVIEVLSFGVVLGIAFWMSRYWLTEPGASPILIILLLLPTCIAVWLRRRQRAAQEASALQGPEAAIRHDEQMLESMRLGSVMSQLALAGLVLAAVVSLYHRSRGFSAASIASFVLMFLYVFGLQIVLIVWARRVRRRRNKLLAIRRALHPPEPP